MKKIFTTFVGMFLVMVFCSGVSSAAEASFPEPKGFVNDYAGVMTSAGRTDLEGLLNRLDEKSGIEMVVVTVKTVQPLSIEQYAVQLFQKWGIGAAGKDNGVLILVASEDRKVRIEVGYGLEGLLTDVQSKIIINDLMVPAFKKGDYNLGVTSGAVMMLKLIRDEYGVDLELDTRPLPMPARGRKSSPLGSLVTLLFFILVFGLRFGTLFFVMGSGRRSYWSGGMSGGGGSFGGGFGGFGGGMSGGGGASGGW